MRTKTLYRRDGERIGISRFPNFHKSGSIAGMKRLYYGKNALLVRCGMEKPRDFDPFGQTGWSPLATI